MSHENVDSPMTTINRTIWNSFLLLIWAAWWGGLCFYALVVVPIGTELIGSIEQGFITQRVTGWHNALTGVFLVCLLIEAYRNPNRTLWSVVVALAITEVALVVWRSHLTGIMDFDQQTVPNEFYSQHAIYLWITAAECLLGMAMPIILADRTGSTCAK